MTEDNKSKSKAADQHRLVCAGLVDRLSGVVDGSSSLQADEEAHVASCLICQGELMRYRRLLRALHDLRTNIVQPAPGFLAEVLDNIAERGERRAMRSLITGRRAAYTSGIAVAAVAGVTGAILLTGKGRLPVKGFRGPKKAA